MMPILYVKSIEVNDNHFYTKEEIILVSGIEERHLFDLSFHEAKQKLLALPYIANADIRYRFPGKLEIDLVEKKPYVYVKFAGSYLCLNEKGQVIEQMAKIDLDLPVIEGLKFSDFKMEEVLGIENQENWLCVLDIMRDIEKYNYVEKVSVVDVHNLEEIHLYVDKLDVIMGTIDDFDKKLGYLIQIHTQGYNMGVLDVSAYTKSGEAYLTPIT